MLVHPRYVISSAGSQARLLICGASLASSLLISSCATTPRPATTADTPSPPSLKIAVSSSAPPFHGVIGTANHASSPVTASNAAGPAIGDADAIRACTLRMAAAASPDPSVPPSTVRAGYDTTLGVYHQFLSAIGAADDSQANQVWATDTAASPVVECVWDGPFNGPGDPGNYSRAIGIVTRAGNPIPGSAAAYGTSSYVDRGWLARP